MSKQTPEINLQSFDREETSFLALALNLLWIDGNDKLTNKQDLADIEKKNLEYQLKMSTNLIKKIESF